MRALLIRQATESIEHVTTTDRTRQSAIAVDQPVGTAVRGRSPNDRETSRRDLPSCGWRQGDNGGTYSIHVVAVAAARARASHRVACRENCGWRAGRRARRGSPASSAHSGSVRAVGGNTRGLQLHAAAAADARPAIIFEVDPHASVSRGRRLSHRGRRRRYQGYRALAARRILWRSHPVAAADAAWLDPRQHGSRFPKASSTITRVSRGARCYSIQDAIFRAWPTSRN